MLSVPGEVSHWRVSQPAHPAPATPHEADPGTPPLMWQSSLERLSYFKRVSKHCVFHIQLQISQVMPFFCFTLCAYLTHTQFFALPTQGENNSFPPMARLPFTPREPWPFLVTQSLSTMLALTLSPKMAVGIPQGQEQLCNSLPHCHALRVFTFLVGEHLARGSLFVSFPESSTPGPRHCKHCGNKNIIRHKQEDCKKPVCH